jgi:hypothetical protein
VFNLFAWVRQQARDAVLAGIEDGAKALAADGEPPADLSELRGRLAAAVAVAALPAAEETAGRSRRK